MADDLRLQVLRRAVADLVEFNGGLAERLEQARRLSSVHPETLAAILHLRPMVLASRADLAAFLGDSLGVAQSREATVPRPGPIDGSDLSECVHDLCLALHQCALRFGMLYEMALRLYEPRLRETAPKHLRAYASAAQSLARILPAIVAWQLDQGGLQCACVCPLCGIGACGCVDLGTETLVDAWRDAVATASEPSGFVLQPPKRGSQLARSAVLGGELLLAVDGQQVPGRAAAQDAIRKHLIGDEVRLLLQGGSEPPRELIVRHVSDYPTT